MSGETIQMNRAPVLTLWATVVAMRLGFDTDEAMSLGKAVAGFTAQGKGRVLGIYQPAKVRSEADAERKRGEEFWIELCGKPIPAVHTARGVRAVVGDKPIEPEGVTRYLESKFGDDLQRVRAAMSELAGARDARQLAEEAFALYQKFRPAIPAGKKGWGAKGTLDLGAIRALV